MVVVVVFVIALFQTASMLVVNLAKTNVITVTNVQTLVMILNVNNASVTNVNQIVQKTGIPVVIQQTVAVVTTVEAAIWTGNTVLIVNKTLDVKIHQIVVLATHLFVEQGRHHHRYHHHQKVAEGDNMACQDLHQLYQYEVMPAQLV
jgi:hypothetical protein